MTSPPSSPPPEVPAAPCALMPLEVDAELEGTGRSGLGVGTGSTPLPVTGGGVAVLVSAERGFLGAWGAEARICGPLELRLGGRQLPPAPRLETGAGGWLRSIPLPATAPPETPSEHGPGGHRPSRELPPPPSGPVPLLEERGLLQDVLPAPVVQWMLRLPPGQGDHPEHPSAELIVSIHASVPPGPSDPSDGEDSVSLRLLPGRPVSLVLLPPGADPGRVASVLRPLRARERQRAGHRTASLGCDIELREEGRDPIHPLEEAALICEDAAIAVLPGEAPSPPFLGGVDTGGPAWLSSSGLSEVGLAAAMSGQHQLALSVLERLVSEGSPPPFALLLLAAEVAHWSGRYEILTRLRAPIDAALVRILEDPVRAPPSAAYPTLVDLLERLGHAAESAGEVLWADRMRAICRERATHPAPVRLPVLGPLPTANLAPAAHIRDDSRSSPQLPRPEDFPAPGSRSSTSSRTLLAARLVRSWIEGALGARPDAASGRLRLAPELRPSWVRLRASGVRQGDVRVALDCLRVGPLFTFHLSQDAGRSPVNLVFEPWLPLRSVCSLRIGDEAADLSVEEEGAGVRLRCQFPLDPERRVTIEGIA